MFARVACVLAIVAALVPEVGRADASRLVINEIFYDAVGTDTGQEWIELFNAGSETVDVGDWRIERGGTSFTRAGVLPAGTTIAPGGFFVIGESLVLGADVQATLTLQNGGTATDGVRLVTASGEVVDVLLYDTPNVNALPDETGALPPETNAAPDVPEGHSLARLPDGSDTNVNAADFIDVSSPSPGGPNVGSSPSVSPIPSSPQRSVPTGVVVSEALPNPVGDDADGEFVELFNTTSAAIDLSGAQLDDADGGSTPYIIPARTSIAATGYLVFSRSDTGIALNNEGDSARLLAPDGSLVHALVYGKAPKEGTSWARKSDGSADWTVSPTAGTPNVFVSVEAAGEKRPAVSPRARGSATVSPSPRPSAVASSTSTPRGSQRVRGTAAVRSSTPGAQSSEANVSSPSERKTAPVSRVTAESEDSADSSTDAGTESTPSPTASLSPVASDPSRVSIPAVLSWVVAGVLGLSAVLRKPRT